MSRAGDDVVGAVTAVMALGLGRARIATTWVGPALAVRAVCYICVVHPPKVIRSRSGIHQAEVLTPDAYIRGGALAHY